MGSGTAFARAYGSQSRVPSGAAPEPGAWEPGVHSCPLRPDHLTLRKKRVSKVPPLPAPQAGRGEPEPGCPVRTLPRAPQLLPVRPADTPGAGAAGCGDRGFGRRKGMGEPGLPRTEAEGVRPGEGAGEPLAWGPRVERSMGLALSLHLTSESPGRGVALPAAGSVSPERPRPRVGGGWMRRSPRRDRRVKAARGSVRGRAAPVRPAGPGAAQNVTAALPSAAAGSRLPGERARL